MELKFRNITKFNSKIYKEFLKFHTQNNFGKNAFYAILVISALLYMVIYNAYNNNFKRAVIIFIFMIFIISFRVFLQKNKIKEEMQSEKVKNEQEFEFCFYDEYFTIKNLNDKEKQTYKIINKAYETNGFFYLYINKEDAFILDKNGFLEGDEKAFREFISSKAIFKNKVLK